MEVNTQNYKKRTRVNFSCSVKGIITPEVTVERLDSNNLDTLNEAVELLEQALQRAKMYTKQEE
jgi:hypothetical protein